VLTKRGSQQVYSTILKSKEWMIINCVINVVGGVLPRFYIFKDERIREDTFNNVSQDLVWQCGKKHG
jgi:hypothetical protein